jgi:hypothetical protein
MAPGTMTGSVLGLAAVVTADPPRMSGSVLTSPGSSTPVGGLATMSGSVLTSPGGVVSMPVGAKMSGSVLTLANATPPVTTPSSTGRFRYQRSSGTWKRYVRYRFVLASHSWQPHEYGSASAAALPAPTFNDTYLDIYTDGHASGNGVPVVVASLVVADNSDGTATASSTDGSVVDNGSGTATLTSSSAVDNNNGTATITG